MLLWWWGELLLLLRGAGCCLLLVDVGVVVVSASWRHGGGRSGWLGAAVVDEFGHEFLAAAGEGLGGFFGGAEVAGAAAEGWAGVEVGWEAGRRQGWRDVRVG